MNLAREDEAYVLFTGREVPAVAFEIELRDLRSRLRAVPVVAAAARRSALPRA